MNDFRKQAIERGAIDLTLGTSCDHVCNYDRENNYLCRAFEIDGKKYYQQIRLSVLKRMIQWAEEQKGEATELSFNGL